MHPTAIMGGSKTFVILLMQHFTGMVVSLGWDEAARVMSSVLATPVIDLFIAHLSDQGYKLLK